MKRGAKLMTKSFVFALLVILFPQAPAIAQVVFADTFDGPTLNGTKWGVGTWQLGRTQLRNQPTFTQEDGVTFVTLRLDTYNPAFPGTLLSGTEIYSSTTFSLPRRRQGIQFEARVRVRSETRGFVASFFTWGFKTSVGGSTLSDEIDFEYLTKQPSDYVLLTTWNDWNEATPTYNDGIHHSEDLVMLGGLNRSAWNVLQIRWLKDRTEWYINGLLARSTQDAHATDPMTVRFNLWAPNFYWTAAYDAGLQPVLTATQNASYYYDIDYVRVTKIP